MNSFPDCPPWLANSLWYLACMPEQLRFARALRDIAAMQERRLMEIVRSNAESAYGRRYRFTTIRSITDYQARVPLTTYDDYVGLIDRIGAGERHVLTSTPVLLFEPTSGSTAASKYIPYTAALKAEFQRAIAAWIADLYRHDPLLLLGQAYWSVSPVVQQMSQTAAGIPVGFEDDSAYVGRLQGALLRSILAVPSLVRLIGDMDAFQYVTLLFLLRSQTLSLISVWNPTFLTLLVERLPDWHARLAADIAAGTISPPAPIDADLLAHLHALAPPAPAARRRYRPCFARLLAPQHGTRSSGRGSGSSAAGPTVMPCATPPCWRDCSRMRGCSPKGCSRPRAS